MANKLFLVSATLAFFFLLTNASNYRTVVEFDEDDATNRIVPYRPQQQCQFQPAKLRNCMWYIRHWATQGPRALDEEFVFEDDVENQRSSQQKPHGLLCCNELRDEEPNCVCPTLKQAAKVVALQGLREPQVRRVVETARILPNICNIPYVGVCPWNIPPY